MLDNLNTIGVDKYHHWWFRCDSLITQITHATHFKITKSWFRNQWKLKAKFLSGDYPWGYYYQTIGIYRTSDQASNGLTEALKLFDFKPLYEIEFLRENENRTAKLAREANQ